MIFDAFFKRYKYGNTRQYLRLPASWPVKCDLLAGEEGKPAPTMHDISAGGLSMTVPSPIPVGTRMRLDVHVPPLNRSISAETLVVRCQPGRGGFDIGVRFLDIGNQDRAALDGAIEKFYGPRQRLQQQQKTWWRKIA